MEAELDDEIATLKARGILSIRVIRKHTSRLMNAWRAVETLKVQVRLQANALLTTESTREAIAIANTSTVRNSSQSSLQARVDKQQAYNQQCLYRACTAITTFRVRDPDPCAVDHGNVLGIRIEVVTRAKFLRPYYVLLNRPYTTSKHGHRFLRVHRHTIPPCIPLNGLAARHLPAPNSKSELAADDENNSAGRHEDGQYLRPEPSQDLSRFAKSLRREIVRYHNRVAVVADLRKALGLDGKRKDAKDVAERSPILAISAADAEAKQVRIDWKDGRSGRLVVGNDGEVVKLVVFGDRGRERELTRELLDSGSRLEQLAESLTAM